MAILNSAYDEPREVVWPELVELFASKAFAKLAMAVAQSPEQFGWVPQWQQKQFRDPLPEHLQAYFDSVKAVKGITPDRVTTDGRDSYPRAIRTKLGKAVRHRASRYLNNGLEQDHCGIKGRYRPMRGFKCPFSAARFCRAHDELRHFLRPRSRHNQHVPVASRRPRLLGRTVTALAILHAA